MKNRISQLVYRFCFPTQKNLPHPHQSGYGDCFHKIRLGHRFICASYVAKTNLEAVHAYYEIGMARIS